MKNLNALKSLYVALGGSSATVAALTVSADVISAIATLIGTQGGQLPAVTSENSGQVLTVNASGAWVAADLPADADPTPGG